MIELSRRWFLFGSAAALASTTLTLPTVGATSVLQAPSTRQSTGTRFVYELLFSVNTQDDGQLLLIEVARQHPSSNGLPLVSTHISPRGCFRWVNYGCPIILPHDHALKLAVSPDPGLNARMTVTHRDSTGARFAEEFQWRNGNAVLSNCQSMDA